MVQSRYFTSTAQATTLTAGITNTDTSLTVKALTGYPVSLPWTAILERDTTNEEVVTVTAVSGTTVTVTRGVDGTTAVAHSSGAAFEHGISARDFNDPQAHMGSSAGVHGVTGNVVGDSDAQTLTNKTLTTPTVNGSGGALTLPAGPDTLVGRATTDTLTNKTLTNPTVNGSGGQLTLPAGPDTLVGRATTDTLTNKTLTNPTINGTGGKLALPAGPDTLVGEATAQTLSNKTLSSPTIDTPTINGSGGALTLPAGPDTLVSENATQTLTNKTLSGMTASYSNSNLAVVADGNRTGGTPTRLIAGTFTASFNASYAAGGTINFPSAFPTTCVAVILTPQADPSNYDVSADVTTTSTTGFSFRAWTQAHSGTPTFTQTMGYIAIGY